MHSGWTLHDLVPSLVLGLFGSGSSLVVALVAFLVCGGVGLLCWSSFTTETARHVPRGYVESLCFSGDGAVLAAGRSFGRIELWDAARGRLLRSVGDLEGKQVTLDETGTRIVAGNERRSALYDLHSNRLLAEEGGVTSVVANLSRTHAVSPSIDGRLLIWNLAAGSLDARLRFDRGGVSAVAIGHHGRECAIGTASGEVYVMNVEASIIERQLAVPDRSSVVALAFDGSGRLAAATARGGVSVWNDSAAQPVWSLTTAGAGRVSHLRLLDADRVLTVVGNRLELHVRDADPQTWDVPLQTIDALTVPSDGNLAAVGSREESEVLLFDLRSGRQAAELDIGGD